MPPAAFEPTISAGEQPQIHALDRAATVTGHTERYKLTINTSVDCYHGLNCLLHTTISAATAVLQHVMCQPPTPDVHKQG